MSPRQRHQFARPLVGLMAGVLGVCVVAGRAAGQDAPQPAKPEPTAPNGPAVSTPQAGPGPAVNPARGPERRGKVWHLKLRGDLDCTRLVTQVSEELTKAETEGATLLLLELDGERWRADVVWGIAQAVKSAAIPTHTILIDVKDGRVGTGHTALGLVASGRDGSLWIAPKMTIGMRPEDDLRATAPEGTDFERVDRELSGSAWSRLKSIGASTELAAVLLTPSAAGPAWAVPDADGAAWRLTATRPGVDENRAVRVVSVVPSAAGSPGSPGATGAGGAGGAGARVELPAEVACRLALVREARTAGDVLAKVASGPHATVVRELRSGLAQAREQVEADAAKFDRSLEQADRILHDLPRPSDADYERRKARAGRDAQTILRALPAILDRCERLVLDYPELLRDAAPGRTPIGEDQKSLRQTWRQSFQKRRDDLTRMTARAAELAGP